MKKISPKRLEARKNVLLRHSQALREDVAVQSQALLPFLKVGDDARAASNWVKKNPWLPIAAAALVVVIWPKKAFSLAGKAWSVWQVSQTVADLARQKQGAGQVDGANESIR